jgi:hypothetical protein
MSEGITRCRQAHPRVLDPDPSTRPSMISSFDDLNKRISLRKVLQANGSWHFYHSLKLS